MEYTDTVKLLKECDSGTKMGVTSIDEVMDMVKDDGLKRLLIESKDHHSKLGNKIHDELIKTGSEEKDPGLIAKGMSWIKTNVKMGMKDSDTTVADLITDGCHMGIKSLCRYLNQYKAADETSKGLCRELIAIEENLASDLRRYL